VVTAMPAFEDPDPEDVRPYHGHAAAFFRVLSHSPSPRCTGHR
jgi:hypothetical protein